ncbi:unnamed protein product [Dimorphilus gyrociliatus]|uniref:Uncharacterized protein n=1 Tax=Dimorphilus gyrociliatus TaxID=2664684 RepID=A0A7I8W4A5_9ANNE|nr:unnamed protein product [Dimorphilus gyrociliatus]
MKVNCNLKLKTYSDDEEVHSFCQKQHPYCMMSLVEGGQCDSCSQVCNSEEVSIQQCKNYCPEAYKWMQEQKSKKPDNSKLSRPIIYAIIGTCLILIAVLCLVIRSLKKKKIEICYQARKMEEETGCVANAQLVNGVHN